MDLIIDQKQGLNGQRKSKVTFTRQGRVRTEAVIYVWFVLWRKFGGINSCVTPVSLGSQLMLSCPVSSWMYLFGPKREVETEDLKLGVIRKELDVKLRG